MPRSRSSLIAALPAVRIATARGGAPAPAAARVRGRVRAMRRLLTGFAAAREGATAVEFGLIAMPFLCLVAAIIETAMAFFAGQVLDNAVSSASRQLYTGQFQAARAADPTPPSDPKAQEVALQKFNEVLCKGRVTIFSCSAVKVDVITPDDAGFTPPSPVDAESRSWRSSPRPFGTRYDNPGPGQIVIVQAAVEFPVFFSFLSPKTLVNGNRVLQSTVAFRTEPFQ